MAFNSAFKGLNFVLKVYGGTRWRSWLRHCATSRKVAGSIPGGVTGIFHRHNLSGRTVGLGLTQPLTEMSTRNISWRGKGAQCVQLTILPPSCADCLEIWEPQNSWNPQGLFRPVMGWLYPYQFICECEQPLDNSCSPLNYFTFHF